MAFSGLERLSALNLVNNELRSLDSAMRLTLPSRLRVLRLYRNPWTCDCRLRWLRRWLVTRDGSTADDVDSTVNWDFASNTPTCAAPALIRGVAWRHLTADQFACPSRIIAVSAVGTSNNATTTTGIHATSGLNATVRCVAAGDPEPIISWTRGDQSGHVLAPPMALVSVRQAAAGGDGEPRIVSELTLVSVSASRDSGDYSCMAENTAGRAEMTFKLTVHDAPLAGTSSTRLWPIDRDAFLGILLGLFVVACVVVVCTVLRLRSIARRRRRLHGKNVYYVANTANHVGPSPTHNHRPAPDVESTPAPAQTAVDDDDDSKSSEVQSFLGDGKTTAGSPRHPLLSDYNQHWSERSEENGRRGKKKHNEVMSKRQRDGATGEARGLLSADEGGQFEVPGDDVEDEVRHDDQASLSEKLSDVASDDADDATTNGDDAANHRERPSRAVSFGPDMIIDARRRSSSGGERDDSPRDGDAEVTCESDDGDRRRSVHERHDEPVYQRPVVSCSPSIDRFPPANRRSGTAADRPATAPSPGLSVGDSPRLTLTGGRRLSGELRLIGNGSVRGGSGSHLLDRPLSPQTPTPLPFSGSRPSKSASLERNASGKTRRRLPIPINKAPRRCPGPGMIGRCQGASSPRDVVALPGNHVADCTPVSLAELLAPPFGGVASSAVRQLQQVRPPVKMASDSRRSAQRSDANSVFDDDSGTDI